ncbi:hypothetical protein A2982_03390 [candidate division WWE3 bacterium RIFCSPLOWO2_01_FULL_39_13]|uniref:PPM-type phosphatase domain-containing protein n=1 Tax=candidate division WWE3 bacterium RIFCSPLOWO2_01_FULL_39_13 TaxID=1802624 RepID=A0A1F4V3G2_UNCKA|nr:MAG: hypothetical protein A2982_03390 [candidate division WWE3 bacterium RIFCSPLOWO2_01_FULL_39_13]
MKLKFFVYHENNLEKPYLPQEDFYANHENIFVVADGITHDLQDGLYPSPSDSAEVAKIICSTFISELKNTEKELSDIKRAVKIINQKVMKFNRSSELYKNRENNAFTIGAVVFALIIIKKDKLIYYVLDDSFFSIFSDDLVDHPTLKSYVNISAEYYKAHYDWTKPEERKAWRKDYRNNSFEIDGQTLGYGAIDGREGFDKFVQCGEESLKSNDLICLYTDGFIPAMKDTRFVKEIKNSEFSIESSDFISKYTKRNKMHKEKTCYFIKCID